mmetsp:Transcript_28595/g.77426  ORF Transcript_28595/g.77426 Transcript_28595/m.77426 type:complete len:247 (+) Transcript_28595:3073-3813(+)
MSPVLAISTMSRRDRVARTAFQGIDSVLVLAVVAVVVVAVEVTLAVTLAVALALALALEPGVALPFRSNSPSCTPLCQRPTKANPDGLWSARSSSVLSPLPSPGFWDAVSVSCGSRIGFHSNEPEGDASSSSSPFVSEVFAAAAAARCRNHWWFRVTAFTFRLRENSLSSTSSKSETVWWDRRPSKEAVTYRSGVSFCFPCGVETEMALLVFLEVFPVDSSLRSKDGTVNRVYGSNQGSGDASRNV